MPRYFFDVVSGNVKTTDVTGEILDDTDTARDVALSVLISVGRDELPSEGGRKFHIQVRDHIGATVFRASLEVDTMGGGAEPAGD